MARTKGSKNKATIKIEEKIAAVMGQIAEKENELKALKADLKALQKEKAAADKKKILDAIEASGKSTEEILAMLTGDAK